MARLRCSVLFLLAACARTPVPPPSVPQAASSAAAPADPRALAAEANFADVVRAAGLLDGQTSPARGCLLGMSPAGFRFAAEVATGVRPLPAPVEDLDAMLAEGTQVSLLTPWGSYGSGANALTFVSFTMFPPERRAFLVAVTDRGLTLRATTADVQLPSAAQPIATGLDALGDLQGAAVFVTAEGRVPVADLFPLLGELARRGANTSFAVNLAPGTRLPAPPSAPANVLLRCPEGLSETQVVTGDLSQEAVLEGLTPLREHAAECLTQGSAAGAAGGKLVLGLRIDERGSVSETCVENDELGDSAVVACVLTLARSLRFPAPSPAGVVDVELPLSLRPNSIPAQAPVCPNTES